MSAFSSPSYDSPFHDRNPSPPPELLHHKEGDLIHADTVGESAFSKQWIFSILMKLIQVVNKETIPVTATTNETPTVYAETTDTSHNINSSEISVCSSAGKPVAANVVESETGKASCEDDKCLDVDDDVQTELCQLWDMSTDQNVCEFLQEYKAVDLLIGIIAQTKAPRVAEICTGILANMSCVSDICEVLAGSNKLEMFVVMLDTRDTPTLNETVRLLHTCMSNPKVSSTLLEHLLTVPETSNNLNFILSSSTNAPLLKNVGELLDSIFDKYLVQVEKWIDSNLVHGLLESITQLRCANETIDAYIHILQTLSTSDTGVEELVQHAERLRLVLQKYLDYICEFDVGGIEGKEATLASVLAIYNVIFASSPDVMTYCLESEHFLRSLLKIVEALEPIRSKKTHQCGSCDQSAEVSISASPIIFAGGDSNSNQSSLSLKDNDTTSVSDIKKTMLRDEVLKTANGIGDSNSTAIAETVTEPLALKNTNAMGDSISSNDSETKTVSEAHGHAASKSSSSVEIKILTEIVSGFVNDVMSAIPLMHNNKENTDFSPHPLLTCLNNQFSSSRIFSLIHLLSDTNPDLLEKLHSESVYHDLLSIYKITGDFVK